MATASCGRAETRCASVVDQTATYRRSARSAFIVPGQSDESLLVEVIGARSSWFPSMPPLGTELVDENAVTLVRRWIDGPLAPRRQP